MADAYIYYRLKSNNSDVSAQATPALLKANFPAQVLVFTLPDELLESVSMVYENNIKDSPVNNPDGSRRITKQDCGLNSIQYTFRGRFKDVSSDIDTLMNFAKRQQVESTAVAGALEYGIFGFFTDNTIVRPYNLDPYVQTPITTSSIQKGLTMKRYTINRSGNAPKNFDFEIMMTFGGIF